MAWHPKTGERVTFRMVDCECDRYERTPDGRCTNCDSVGTVVIAVPWKPVEEICKELGFKPLSESQKRRNLDNETLFIG